MIEEFKLFHTSNAGTLATAVSQLSGVPVGELRAERFSDGEVFVRFEESVRGKTVIILAQAHMPYDHLFELFFAIDAARRAFAKEVVCIVPYLPHSRQERKDSDRSSIAARLIADFVQEAGAHRLVTIDLHSSSVEGFFKIPVDHLTCSPLFAHHIRQQAYEKLCLCSPDFGGLKRIKKYKQIFDCDMAVIHKERLRPNQVDHMEIIGDVEGRSVVIIDDMVDTAGTLCKAAEILKAHGALSVTAYASHGVLSGDAVGRIDRSSLDNVYVSNSIVGEGQGKINVVSCAPILAKAVQSWVENKSLEIINQDLDTDLLSL